MPLETQAASLSCRARSAAEAAWQWTNGLPLARGTCIWLAIVTATQLVINHASGRLDIALLRSASTNLHNLRADPVSVLIISAFFVDNFRSYLSFIAACALILAPLENWIGPWRWLSGLLIGHVGATLVIAAGLWISSYTSGVSNARAIDVGVSYGVWFLTAVLIRRWPDRLPVTATFLLIAAAAALALGRTFSDWGHIVAVVLGLALGPALLRGIDRTPAPDPDLATC